LIVPSPTPTKNFCANLLTKQTNKPGQKHDLNTATRRG